MAAQVQAMTEVWYAIQISWESLSKQKELVKMIRSH